MKWYWIIKNKKILSIKLVDWIECVIWSINDWTYNLNWKKNSWFNWSIELVAWTDWSIDELTNLSMEWLTTDLFVQSNWLFKLFDKWINSTEPIQLSELIQLDQLNQLNQLNHHGFRNYEWIHLVHWMNSVRELCDELVNAIG